MPQQQVGPVRPLTPKQEYASNINTLIIGAPRSNSSLDGRGRVFAFSSAVI